MDAELFEQQRQGLRRHAAIEGERLYVSNDEGRVLAVDLNTGDVLWDSEVVKTGKTGSLLLFWRRKTLEGGVSGGPGVGNGLVVAGGRNGEVVALDAETGAERWDEQMFRLRGLEPHVKAKAFRDAFGAAFRVPTPGRITLDKRLPVASSRYSPVVML